MMRPTTDRVRDMAGWHSGRCYDSLEQTQRFYISLDEWHRDKVTTTTLLAPDPSKHAWGQDGTGLEPP